MQELSHVIESYGIYAVFALCTVEGDITLLMSGAMANRGFFGNYSFLWVLIAGTLGGMAGDHVGYGLGRVFHENAKDYRFYAMAQPRIERLIDKFGNFALIISKYIYGLRLAMCLFYGIARMPYLRFLAFDAISCFLWAFLLAFTGYFFSGAITSIIGDFQQIGVALFFVILAVVILVYVIERYWLSERVETVEEETIAKIEETIHAVEGAAQERLHDLSEKLHLTRDANRDLDNDDEPPRQLTRRERRARRRS